MKRLTLADAGTAVLVLCAVAIVGLVARRELAAGGSTSAAPFFRPVEAAELLAAEGQLLGPADAPVRIVEFSDFECQYCARTKKDLRRLRELFPTEVAIVYRHFPLDATHRYARTAALAAECAGEQGRFEAYHDALYADQHAIGVRSWKAFAEIAAVPDLPRFTRCVVDRRFADRVDRDVRAGDAAGVAATPTVVVDGQMFSGTLSEAEWVKRVHRALGRP